MSKNKAFLGFEIINEEEKDQDPEIIDSSNSKESQNKIFQSIKNHGKSKSFANKDEFLKIGEHKKAKSLNLNNDSLNFNLKECQLEKLDNDCYSILRVLVQTTLNLLKDFQNNVSSFSKKTQIFAEEIQKSQISISKEKEIRLFVKEVDDNYKDFTLVLVDMIKLIGETAGFIQKAQGIYEAQELVLHTRELEIKGKLEEIVKLHENIINLQKKEIKFEENINEIYERYMLVLEEKEQEDHANWLKLDLFKKFTRVVESLVQERLQGRAQTRENEQMSNDISDLQKKINNLSREIQRKNENIAKIEGREKNIKKDRDFFYSQLIYLKKKLADNISSTEIQEENEDFVRKLKGLDGSVRTIIENLNIYEQNKDKFI